MRCIAQYYEQEHPPLLVFYIHGAPHERIHQAIIKVYRQELLEACDKIGLPLPIDHPIDMRVHFVDPTSEDLDHLLVALYRALDHKSIKVGRSVLTDDRLIQHVSMGKMFPNEKKIITEQPLQLPRFNVMPATTVAA